MRGWLIGVCAIALALAAAPGAHAQFGVDPDKWIAQVYGTDVETETQATQEYGQVGIYDQAGGHPWKGITDFTLRLGPDGNPAGGNPSNVRVDVPVGLVPNPTIFPRCPRVLFDSGSGACPSDSQIGIEELTIKEGPLVAEVQVPLYNVEINPGEVSLFGFHPADAAPVVPALATALAGMHPVYIVGGVRDQPSQFGPHDTGLFFTIDDAPATPPVLRSKLTFWGVPGDPVHDVARDNPCVTIISGPLPAGRACTRPEAGVGIPSTVPDIPFLSNPTKCGGVTLFTRLSLWSHSGAFASVDDPTPTINGRDGPQRCDRVPFDSAIEVTPNTAQPDAPVGPVVRHITPQPGLRAKDVITTSHVKDVSVTLPPGMTLNPSAANGLMACTDAQLAANPGVVGGDECPEASQVGTAAAKSPLLPDAVTGSAFVGQPLAGDKYRLFVTLEGRGVSVRLKGSVRPDPQTGQVTTTFANNPEQPVDTFDIDIEDGSRAPLATPLDCGTKTASAVTTPWSGTAPDSATSSFTIGAGGCSPGFAPAFGARTGSSTAGGFTPVTASIARADGDQFLSGVRVDMPPGLGAIVKKMPKCSSTLAARGACPASTLIGTASTRSGAGAEPFPLSGPVYFTEGYKGAPFGMVAVIRAIAGPYDLGTVVVRQSVFVDPEDAHITVVSDPLPQILEGVPIRLRAVDVTIDRSKFVYNPTSCGRKSVGTTLHSIQGAVSRSSSSIATDRCQALRFKPRMSMRLTGRRQVKLGKHPGLRVRVRQARGQANIGRARVVLPLSLALDPANARAICGFEAGLKARCPAKSKIGRARAVSPALNRPLRGPVYFVQGIRIDPETGNRIRTLPSLLVKLNGEIRVNLRGTTSVARRRLVSTFPTVPDAPVSRFDMRLKGGKGGILTVATRARRGICARRRQISRAVFIGHNGKRKVQRVKMAKPCKKRKAPRKRRR
ncbi:MAG TPA: hypothetical protein VHF88_07550 [Thermoleophilaceae bacterium]|nr:hypothetical protein [Thermoleophilaceae bacterium]